jgi:hypothetical protein
MPNGKELADELAAAVMYPDPEDRDLMRVSQYVEAKLGDGALYRKVRATFNAMYPPTSLHVFLARMAAILRERDVPRQVILTTNYDDALERAFEALGEPYELLWYEAKEPHSGRFVHARNGVGEPILVPNEYAELDPDERTVIVKLHGAMVRSAAAQDSYVITEDDYINYITRSDIVSQLPTVLRTRISEHHLLFLGYSMRDWNLRVVLERLMGRSALGMSAWSVQRRPSRAVSEEIERILWDNRKIELMFVLLDEYVARLEEQLEQRGIGGP